MTYNYVIYDRGIDWEDKSITSQDFPETDAEELETGVLDSRWYMIYKVPQRTKMGFHV